MSDQQMIYLNIGLSENKNFIQIKQKQYIPVYQMKLNDIIKQYHPKGQHKSTLSDVKHLKNSEKDSSHSSSERLSGSFVQEPKPQILKEKIEPKTNQRNNIEGCLSPSFIKSRKVHEIKPNQILKSNEVIKPQFETPKQNFKINIPQVSFNYERHDNSSQNSQTMIRQFLSQNTSYDTIKQQCKMNIPNDINRDPGQRNRTTSAFYQKNNSFNNYNSPRNSYQHSEIEANNGKNLQQTRKLLIISMKSCKDLQCNVKREENINKDLKAQIAEKDRELIDLRIENTKIKGQIQSKRKKIIDVQQTLDFKESNFQEMTKENRSLRILCQKLQRQLGDAQNSIISKVQQFEAKQLDYTKQIVTLTSECLKKQELYEQKRKEHQYLSKDYQVLKQKVLFLQKSLISKKDEIEQLKNKHGDIIKQMTIARHQQNSKIKQKQANQKKEINNKLQNMKISYEEQLLNIQKEKKDFRLKLDQAYQQIQALKAKILENNKFFQIEKANFDEELSQAQNQFQMLQTRINQTKLTNQKYMELLKDQNEEEITRADKKNTFYQSMNGQLHRDIEFRKQLQNKYMTEIKQYRAQVIKSESLIEKLKFEVQRLQQDKAKMESQLKSITSEKQEYFRKTIQQCNRGKELQLNNQKVKAQCLKMQEITKIQYQQLLSKKDYEHQNYKRNTDNIISNLKLDIERGTQNNNNLKGQMEVLEGWINSYNENIKKYKSQVFEAKQGEIKVTKLLQQSNLAKNEEINKLKSEIQEQKIQLRFLSLQYKTMEEQLNKNHKLQITFQEKFCQKLQPEYLIGEDEVKYAKYEKRLTQDDDVIKLKSELEAKNLKLIVLRSNCKTLEMEREKFIEMQKQMGEELESKEDIIQQIKEQLMRQKQINKNLQNQLQKFQIFKQIRESNLSQVIYSNYQQILKIFNIHWQPLKNRQVPHLQLLSAIKNIQKLNQSSKINNEHLELLNNQLTTKCQTVVQKLAKAQKFIIYQAKLLEIVNLECKKSSKDQIDLQITIKSKQCSNQFIQKLNYKSQSQTPETLCDNNPQTIELLHSLFPASGEGFKLAAQNYEAFIIQMGQDFQP